MAVKKLQPFNLKQPPIFPWLRSPARLAFGVVFLLEWGTSRTSRFSTKTVFLKGQNHTVTLPEIHLGMKQTPVTAKVGKISYQNPYPFFFGIPPNARKINLRASSRAL